MVSLTSLSFTLSSPIILIKIYLLYMYIKTKLWNTVDEKYFCLHFCLNW